MNEEELLLALGYLLLKRRIRRRKQLEANVRRMWVREIFKERERKGILFSQANSFLFLSLKYLSDLSQSTGYFLTASASLSSAMFKCVKMFSPLLGFYSVHKTSCACCVQRSHYKIYEA